MIPDPRFVTLPKHFWANVRTISQHTGYAARGQIVVPTLRQMRECMKALNLSATHLMDDAERPTSFGTTLLDYFNHRAAVLNSFVEPRLMDVEKAKSLFDKLQRDFPTKRTHPMNKQTGEKKAPAYFTGSINMLIEKYVGGLPCDYDPKELTTVTFNNAPLRTLARRVDGAFPGPVNPIAVWEIKEYYYSRTGGSRVAGGVYESLLDGMELEELRSQENIQIKHYLMIDAHYTWWHWGRSFLCRIIDILHMGYVDEVLFGREIEERLPTIVKEWVEIARERTSN